MRISTRCRWALVGALECALVLGGGHALALETEYLDKPKEKKEKRQGWDGMLRVSGNATLNSNNNVVGKPEGVSFTFGGEFLGTADYNMGQHEWRNTLTLQLAFSKVPDVEWFKSGDRLELDSIYLYHLKSIPWLGPFGRLNYRTAILPGWDARPESYTYISGTTEVGQGTRFSLTSAFSPSMFKESVGMFANPLEETWLKVEFRVGLGGQQAASASGDWVVKKVDTSTTTVTVQELDSYAQFGGEVAVELVGYVQDKRVIYSAFAETLLPFYTSGDNSGKSFDELMTAEMGARLSFKLVSWASLEYELRVQWLPKLLDEWQVVNSLMLSLSYTKLMHPPEKKEATTAK
jgi:hypothetical protein